MERNFLYRDGSVRRIEEEPLQPSSWGEDVERVPYRQNRGPSRGVWGFLPPSE